MKPQLSLPRLAVVFLICTAIPAALSASGAPVDNFASDAQSETSGTTRESTVVSAEVLEGVIIRWPTETETSYTIEWSDDLSAESWMELIQVPGDGTFQSVFDTIEPTGTNWYRVVENP